jgi:hypothetical protein
MTFPYAQGSDNYFLLISLYIRQLSQSDIVFNSRRTYISPCLINKIIHKQSITMPLVLSILLTQLLIDTSHL